MHNPENGPTSDAPRHDRVRVVLNHGVRWHVWEGAALGDGDVAAGPVPHLFFASEQGVRRVQGYPDGWYDLTDVALMALREAARDRTTPP